MHNFFFRSIVLISIFTGIYNYTFSQTIIDFQNISGVWEQKKSPYLIKNNIQIKQGYSLVIEKGVKIIFQGNYKLSIQGNLSAFGSPKDSILFIPADSVKYWCGISIQRDYMQIDEDSVFFYYVGFKKAMQSDNLPYELSNEDNGGAFSIKNYNRIKFIHCRFTNNSAAGSGGAIFFLNGGEESQLKFCDFIANSASENGGAIALKNANADIYSNQFSTNNAGNSGGAIALEEDRSKIRKNIFKNNMCSENGGALFITHLSGVQVSNNIFQTNKALNNGGAINCDFHSEPNIVNNFLRSNTALKYGGAIHVDDFCYPINISNNLIFNNKATIGGGISIFNTQIGLYANTIVNNRSKKASAIYLNSYVPIYISNDIIFYNKSTAKNQIIYVETGSSPPFLNYSCLQNGLLSVSIKNRRLLAGMINHIIKDAPMFFDPKKHDFELTINSPCINAGPENNAEIVIPKKDLAGKERIYNKVIDMGCFEFIPETEF